MAIHDLIRKLLGMNELSNKEATKIVKVCPNCLSTKIGTVKGFVSDWLTPTIYFCENCKYQGPIALEISYEQLTEFMESHKDGRELKIEIEGRYVQE
jgi:hypothetical protein